MIVSGYYVLNLHLWSLSSQWFRCLWCGQPQRPLVMQGQSCTWIISLLVVQSHHHTRVRKNQVWTYQVSLTEACIQQVHTLLGCHRGDC